MAVSDIQSDGRRCAYRSELRGDSRCSFRSRPLWAHRHLCCRTLTARQFADHRRFSCSHCATEFRSGVGCIASGLPSLRVSPLPAALGLIPMDYRLRLCSRCRHGIPGVRFAPGRRVVTFARVQGRLTTAALFSFCRVNDTVVGVARPGLPSLLVLILGWSSSRYRVVFIPRTLSGAAADPSSGQSGLKRHHVAHSNLELNVLLRLQGECDRLPPIGILESAQSGRLR